MAQNPFKDNQQTADRRRGEYSLGIGRVVSVPDDADHQVAIQPVTQTADGTNVTRPETATVMVTRKPDIALPSEGDLVVFGRFKNRQHIILGTIYSQQSKINSYESGERVVSNADGSGYMEIKENGRINLETSGNQVWIDGEQSLTESSKSTYVGSFTVTGTGDYTVSGLPFQPSMVEFDIHATGGNDVSTAPPTNDNTDANSASHMSGRARDDGFRQATGNSASGNSINAIRKFATSTEAILMEYSDANGNNVGTLQGDVTSWNSDGFTVNISSFSQTEVVQYTAHR